MGRGLPRDILSRLRCRTCGNKPNGVMITNTRLSGAQGGWRTVELRDGRVQLVIWGGEKMMGGRPTLMDLDDVRANAIAALPGLLHAAC